MKVAVSGHRPQSLGRGWSDLPFHDQVRQVLCDYLDLIKPELLYTGMALGVDQWAAQWCIETDTPFVAAIPFKFQHLKWRQSDQERYNRMLKLAVRVVQVDRQPGYIDARTPPDLFSTTKMQTRNRWLVDQLDRTGLDQLVAVIDLTKGGSGTHNCVQYAKDTNKSHLIREIPVNDLALHPSKLDDDDVPF